MICNDKFTRLTVLAISLLLLSSSLRASPPDVIQSGQAIQGTWKLDRDALLEQLVKLAATYPEYTSATDAERAKMRAELRTTVTEMVEKTIVINGSQMTVNGPDGTATATFKITDVKDKVVTLLKTAGGVTTEVSIRVIDRDHIALVQFAAGQDVPMRRDRPNQPAR
jgi:hypothetical protein